MSEYIGLDPSQPLFLLIGFNTTATSAGILNTIKASGGQYKVKMLESATENWESIIAAMNDFNIRLVVVKLSIVAYQLIADPTYQTVSDDLFDRISQIPHIIFAHQQLFDSQVEDDDPEYKPYTPPLSEVLAVVNDFLRDRSLNVMPYNTNAELNVLASAFITEVDEGLIFRIYVPHGRMWANETDRLIQLFREYLAQVGQLTIRLDQQRTNRGIVYEFYSSSDTKDVGILDESGLADQFREFSQFLELAVFNPAEAEAILKSKQVNPKEVVSILTRYAKEGKRLQVDMRHEREQKTLSIRQRLESELIDTLPSNITDHMITSLVEAAVPSISGRLCCINTPRPERRGCKSAAPRLRGHKLCLISSPAQAGDCPAKALGFSPGAFIQQSLSGLYSAVNFGQRLLPTSADGGSLTINIKPQIIQAVNSVVAYEIQGDVQLSADDQHLLQLILEYGQGKETELISAVHELADDTAPSTGRLAAKQKIIGFLGWLGTQAGNIGVDLLKSYVKKRIGLS